MTDYSNGFRIDTFQTHHTVYANSVTSLIQRPNSPALFSPSIQPTIALPSEFVTCAELVFLLVRKFALFLFPQ